MFIFITLENIRGHSVFEKTVKKDLRDEYKVIRNSIVDRKRKSNAACLHLRSFAAFQNAQHPLLHWSYGSELSILEVCREFWSRSSPLILPYCSNASGKMEARVIEDESTMEMDYCGVPAPIYDMCPVLESHHVDFVLIPGLAYDIFGGRLGQGKGSYDRFLRSMPNAIRVGICFDAQIQQTPLPCEPHDIPVSYLITESGILSI